MCALDVRIESPPNIASRLNICEEDIKADDGHDEYMDALFAPLCDCPGGSNRRLAKVNS